MAEAIGLVLSTITLASMFKTSLDLIEYFELSKSYEYDYEMACLKLSLLKSRLETCGQALSIRDNDHEVEKLKGRPSEEIIIHRSLQGIAGIFGSAEVLKDKYDLSPCKRPKYIAVLARTSQPPTLGRNTKHQHIGRDRRFSFLRRSTTWAVRDKQKFDVLIADLDFFISNLETVSSRRHVHSVSLIKMDKKVKSNKPSKSSISAKDKIDTTVARPIASGGNIPDASLVRTSSSSSQVTTVYRQDTQQSANKVPSYTSYDQSPAKSFAAQGYAFRIEQMEDKAAAFQGAVGGAKLPATPKGQSASFGIGTMSGESRSIGGAINSDDLHKFFHPTA